MLNEELKEIFTGKKRNVVIEAIEFLHEETGFNEMFCKYNQDLNLTLEDSTQKLFKKSNFVVKLPQYDENGNLDITISFSNVGFKYMRAIEDIMTKYTSKLIVKYRFYVENSLDYPQLQAPFLFSISAINIEKRTVTFNGSLLLSIQKKVPAINYTVENFRGLKY